MKLTALFMFLLVSQLAAASDDLQLASDEQAKETENRYGNPGENYYDEPVQKRDEAMTSDALREEPADQEAHRDRN